MGPTGFEGCASLGGACLPWRFVVVFSACGGGINCTSELEGFEALSCRWVPWVAEPTCFHAGHRL